MISVEGLKVEFGVKPLFSNVNFVVNNRDKVALVGKNGAGKSTLLKIICGLQKQTDGVVAIPSDTTIGYLPQVMVLQDDTTVRKEAKKAFAGWQSPTKGTLLPRAVCRRAKLEPKQAKNCRHTLTQTLSQQRCLMQFTVLAKNIRKLFYKIIYQYDKK